MTAREDSNLRPPGLAERADLNGELRRFMELVCADGGMRELRALDVVRAAYPDKTAHVETGYFKPEDLDLLVTTAEHYRTERGVPPGSGFSMLRSTAGVYYSLNPIKAAAYGKGPGRMVAARRGQSSSDADVGGRTTMLIDIDAPREVAGVPATDEEKASAFALKELVLALLGAQGWPAPIVVDSGNGYQLLHRIDLPADDGGLVEQVLAALGARFSGSDATIDRSVHNAARIARLPCTRNCKAHHTTERPHRMARVLALPDRFDVVAIELLQKVVALAPKPDLPHRNGRVQKHRQDDVAQAAPRWDFNEAVRRWNADHPRTWPASSSPCDICGSPDGLKASTGDPSRWCCFSSRHEELAGQVNGAQGLGVHGRGCFTGDALDVEAFTSKRTRVQVLKDDGYLEESGGAIHQVEPTEDGPASKPVIRLLPGRLAEVTRKAEEALLEAQGIDPIYQRASELVRVVHLRERTVLRPGTEIAANTPVMTPVAPTWLRAQFEQVAKFVKFDGRSNAWVTKDCPDDVATLYLQSAGNWRVQTLTAIVTAPTLRPDGTVLQQAGYDAATGIIFDPGGIDFPQIADSPSRADALAAVAQLLEPVRLFPWASRHDRSVWLAAVLTAFMRPVLAAAPMFLFDGTVRGSGKTMLAILVALIATGTDPSLMIHVDDDDEQRKRLFALLRRGVQVVCLDNIDRPLEGASLCVALTSPVLEDRILGESRTAAVSTSCTLIGTGNNIHVLGDLTRRVLACRIDPKVERPEERRFDFDPVSFARQHRPRLVSAALTLLRAHVVAGWPAEGLPPFGSFEQWSTHVRAALVWAGEPDPVLGRQAVRDVDDEYAAFAELLRLWHQQYGAHPRTIREAIRSCTGDLLEAVDLVAGDEPRTRSKKLGERIAASRGRVYDGLRFVMEPGMAHGGIRRWRVERVDDDDAPGRQS